MSVEALRAVDAARIDPPAIAPFNPVLWAVRAVWQRKFMIAALTLAGLIAAGAFAARLPDFYTASGLLEVDPDPTNILEQRGNAGFVQAETITQTETEVIQSAAVLSRVVERLQRAEALSGDSGTEGEEASEALSHGEHIETLQRGLSVTPTGRSYIVRVAFEDADPVVAADVVNAVMGEYLDIEVSLSRESSQEAVSLLAERLEGLRADLDAKEQAVLEFRATSRIAEGAGTDILQQQLQNLNVELIRAQSSQAAAAANAAQRLGPTDVLPEVVNSRLIELLRAQEAEQIRAVDELETLYRPNHPRLIQARTALAGLRDTIADETRKIADSLGAEEVIETRRVAAIEAEAERLRQLLNEQTVAEIELGRLEREVEAARRIYQTFLDRFNEVSGVTGLETPDGRIIAAATPPVQPSGPKRLVFVAGGGILSSGLAVALALMLALFDRQLRTAGDVAEATGLVPLEEVPAVPAVGSRAPAFWRSRQNTAFAEAITRLRATLVLSQQRGGPAMVAVTGVDEDSGATPLAVALAQACAIAGDTAVLVDLDFGAPQITHILGGRNEFGVANLISDGGDVLGALQDDGETGLEFLPPGTGGEPAFYRTAEMDDVLDALYARHDVLILLLPPVADVPDAQAIAGVSDITAVVVASGRTDRGDLVEVVDQLRVSASVPRLATVLYRG